MLSPELEMKTSGHNLNACHPDLHVRSYFWKIPAVMVEGSEM